MLLKVLETRESLLTSIGICFQFTLKFISRALLHPYLRPLRCRLCAYKLPRSQRPKLPFNIWEEARSTEYAVHI
ncbi:hypothetical protein E2P81_ATG05913 [Venturia nashicola]|uniref:Uncharacterized protein n=1 Tax=Venturia nashicola TaxID=86259 RepID=A0A4Z1P9L5_9PEZI|nr:hypothetical protein E6O75_ATG06060 [Venturia nashicola]TLD29619.1 hypothetical protein E2P81_ATG05913 [Venturia nashicola]